MFDYNRKEFEKWISSPPYEHNITRFTSDSAWPMQYRDIRVSLAWDAWRTAIRLTQPVRPIREKLNDQ